MHFYINEVGIAALACTCAVWEANAASSLPDAA